MMKFFKFSIYLVKKARISVDSCLINHNNNINSLPFQLVFFLYLPSHYTFAHSSTNSVRLQYKNSVLFKKYVILKKDVFLHQNFPIFKNSPFEKSVIFKNYVFSHKIPCFSKNSVFSKIPRSKKYVLFKKSPFSTKYAS